MTIPILLKLTETLTISAGDTTSTISVDTGIDSGNEADEKLHHHIR